MTLHFETETTILPQVGEEGAEELACLVIEKALDLLACPYEAQVSLLLTGPEGIREMNRSFRDNDHETDVLSFPMTPFPAEADFDWLEGPEAADCFDPESGELLLGDIVINTSRVISQAKAYGHSQRREYAFLVAHSVLHLCGFDHLDMEEELRMFEKQEEILSALGIVREDEKGGNT